MCYDRNIVNISINYTLPPLVSVQIDDSYVTPRSQTSKTVMNESSLCEKIQSALSGILSNLNFI